MIEIKFKKDFEESEKPKVKNDFSNKIIDFYKNFDINLNIEKIVESYAITRYFATLDRSNKKKLKDIERLINDLCLEVAIDKINLTFEDGFIVFEIPKAHKKILNFEDIQTNIDNTQKGLNVCLGKDLNNNNYIIDLCKTPHLLISGTTGSGKSVFINTILVNLLNKYNKKQLEIALIDPKRVELNIYNNLDQITDFADNLRDARSLLFKAVLETEHRYELLEHAGFRNISSYNSNTKVPIPYKLIIIDELADILLQDKKNHKRDSKEPTLENLIVRIAQIGRAAGVHLIVATQRPSSDVITGLIKANIPSRVALSVSSATDSRVILDIKGAEKLTGNGDMYFKMVGSDELVRLQSAFLPDEEIENFINKKVHEENRQKLSYKRKLEETTKQETIKLNNDIKEMKKHPIKNYQKIQAYKLNYDRILKERINITMQAY